MREVLVACAQYGDQSRPPLRSRPPLTEGRGQTSKLGGSIYYVWPELSHKSQGNPYHPPHDGEGETRELRVAFLCGEDRPGQFSKGTMRSLDEQIWEASMRIDLPVLPRMARAHLYPFQIAWQTLEFVQGAMFHVIFMDIAAGQRVINSGKQTMEVFDSEFPVHQDVVSVGLDAPQACDDVPLHSDRECNTWMNRNEAV
jgi:hypothetical protein